MINDKSRRRKVLVSGGLFHIFHDSIADGLAVLLPFWRAAFELSLTQVGLLVTCFESATALFQVPAGLLGERYGERRLLTAGTFVTASCFMLLAFTGNIYHLGILLIIGGLGAGVQHPLASSMVAKAYENQKGFVSLALIGFIDAAVRTSLIVFLPFVLIKKGMPMESGGLALSLLFIGGALGKFACGFLAEKIGIIRSIVITEAVTGFGILYVYAAGLTGIFIFLPLLGMALNGTSSVLYGTVADFVSASHVPRAFSLFYTAIIVAAALAPPVFGWVSDAAGINVTMVCVGMAALATLPVTYFLSAEINDN